MWKEYIRTWSIVDAVKLKVYFKRENIPCIVKHVKGQFILYTRRKENKK